MRSSQDQAKGRSHDKNKQKVFTFAGANVSHYRTVFDVRAVASLQQAFRQSKKKYGVRGIARRAFFFVVRHDFGEPIFHRQKIRNQNKIVVKTKQTQKKQRQARRHRASLPKRANASSLKGERANIIECPLGNMQCPLGNMHVAFVKTSRATVVADYKTTVGNFLNTNMERRNWPRQSAAELCRYLIAADSAQRAAVPALGKIYERILMPAPLMTGFINTIPWSMLRGFAPILSRNKQGLAEDVLLILPVRS